MNTLLDLFTNQITISIALFLSFIIGYCYDNKKYRCQKTIFKIGNLWAIIKPIIKTGNFWTIILVIVLNISLMKYFSSNFNIKQLTEVLNPITGTLLLSITNVLLTLNFIRKNEDIVLFINKNQLLISIITTILTTGFYIIKPTLISTYHSAIAQATSELTLNSIQQYPIFSDIFFPITIEALNFVCALTLAFELAMFLIISIINNNDKKTFYLTLLTLFFISLFSVSHITYLTKMLTEKVLTNQNTGYLIVQYEYYPLNERCNNPHLIELSKTGKYWFKSISHNKVIYVEGIWDDHISKEERTLENITEYRFYPFEEECIKTTKLTALSNTP